MEKIRVKLIQDPLSCLFQKGHFCPLAFRIIQNFFQRPVLILRFFPEDKMLHRHSGHQPGNPIHMVPMQMGQYQQINLLPSTAQQICPSPVTGRAVKISAAVHHHRGIAIQKDDALPLSHIYSRNRRTLPVAGRQTAHKQTQAHHRGSSRKQRPVRPLSFQ